MPDRRPRPDGSRRQPVRVDCRCESPATRRPRPVAFPHRYARVGIRYGQCPTVGRDVGGPLPGGSRSRSAAVLTPVSTSRLVHARPRGALDVGVEPIPDDQGVPGAAMAGGRSRTGPARAYRRRRRAAGRRGRSRERRRDFRCPAKGPSGEGMVESVLVATHRAPALIATHASARSGQPTRGPYPWTTATAVAPRRWPRGSGPTWRISSASAWRPDDEHGRCRRAGRRRASRRRPAPT